ncbi:MAG: nucleotidyltransferase family protein [Clostridia bacterium]|nr:nucleotidyltransferase family protein [Clostridia bacterium]
MTNLPAGVDAVILAGGPNDGPLRDCSPAGYEALIEIGDRPMVDYVVAALAQSPSIRKLVLVGAAEICEQIHRRTVLHALPGDNPVGSVLNGVKALPGDNRVLLVAADIPLITPEAIEDFIQACANTQADFYYPIVSRTDNDRYYPDIKRTYVTLKEGVFTGGNLFLVNPRIIDHCALWAEEMVGLRKSPLGLCRKLGLGIVIKFFCRCLTIAELEQKVSSLLGVQARTVITRHPEIGVDVDKPGDLQSVTRILEGRH